MDQDTPGVASPEKKLSVFKDQMLSAKVATLNLQLLGFSTCSSVWVYGSSEGPMSKSSRQNVVDGHQSKTNMDQGPKHTKVPFTCVDICC